MKFAIKVKFCALSLLLSVSAHGKDQYACFWHQSAPPVKLTIEGNRLAIDHPADDLIPAYTETFDMLTLNTPADQIISAVSACTLVQNTYVFGYKSQTYCWKGDSQQLWIGFHDFTERPDYNSGSRTLRYECVKLG